MSRHETFKQRTVSLSKEQLNGAQSVAEKANRKVGDLAKQVRESAKNSRRDFLKALACVYELTAHLLVDTEAQDEFRRQEVSLKKWRTNAKLPNYLCFNLMAVSRQQASKYAAIILYALELKVSPDELADFVNNWGGMEAAYATARSKAQAASGQGKKRGKLAKSEVAAGGEAAGKSADQPDGNVTGTGNADAKEKSAQAMNRSDEAATRVDENIGGKSSGGNANSSFAEETWFAELQSILEKKRKFAKKKGKAKFVIVGLEVQPTGEINITHTASGAEWKTWADVAFLPTGTELQ